MELGDLITRIAAALGAGLGLFNSWQNWRQNRVRLRVTPISLQVRRDVSNDGHGVITGLFLSPAVAVVNLSSFAVTLDEVGYELGGGENYRLSRIDAPGRRSNGGHWISDKLPQRLEAKSPIRLSWWEEDEQKLKGKRIRRAYAKTACGKISVGRNRTLRTMAKHVAQGNNVVEPVEQEEG